MARSESMKAENQGGQACPILVGISEIPVETWTDGQRFTLTEVDTREPFVFFGGGLWAWLTASVASWKSLRYRLNEEG
ncbi:hypothetical protein U0070_000733 [Myodes glareolus]|uniref:Uncharacterized protein n=1 Tax=Myodes glareolus TaxID=447135 RepID=A0AAW0J5U0_MYOGA